MGDGIAISMEEDTNTFNSVSCISGLLIKNCSATNNGGEQWFMIGEMQLLKIA